MPQKKNLNVAPYYDDFDKSKNFHEVLFRPGFAVQARELTTLQSILKNQAESAGRHLFKEVAMVIPCNLTYIKNFHCVQVEIDFLGIPVSTYFDELVGLKIRGERLLSTFVPTTYAFFLVIFLY